MEKLLSVIIPSYNVGKYLAHGLESLCISEWNDRIEVLVINDGSTDDTGKIGHEFEKRYPDVFRVIDKENGNYGSCINRGLADANGIFIKVMDGDDSFDCAGLSALMKILESFASEDSEIDVVLSRAVHVDETGKRWLLGEALGETEDVPVGRPFGMGEIKMSKPITMSMITYRKSVFDRFKYKQTEGVSYTDMEFRMIPMFFVRRLYSIPDVVYIYLVGRNGQSTEPKNHAKRFQLMADVVERLLVEYNKYQKMICSTSLSYFKRCMQHEINMIYVQSLCGMAQYDVHVDIDEFDRCVKHIGPEFFDEARNWEMRFSGILEPLSFYPVRIWDNWHTVNAPRLLFHRLYKKIFKKYPHYGNR